ncbi:MAG TPA: ParB/RepB/Spo0J family partition protein [Chloroflexota bacterium]|nr:ParB/RepB/Spo0J family partition protein [Chloroflexota bacterium]
MPVTRAKQPYSYEAAAARARVSSTMPLGVRPIRVKRIVGSAGKANQIGPDFLPLEAGPAQRNYRDILNAMKRGDDLPPITVYGLGNRYYVIDGHTRVAAARTLGIEFIDADVIEALPRKEGNVNLTYYARREFERATGLEGIRLTAAWRYHLLQHHVEGYRLYLERSRGREVTLPESARVWFRSQYLPTITEIRRRKLTSTTGGRTSGDIYTDILKRWAEEESLTTSLREMLDRYDQSLERSKLSRAKRTVANVVNATLPKAIPPLDAPRSRALTEADVEAELDALSDEPTEPGSPGVSSTSSP